MSFRGVFITIFLGTALIVAAFIVNGHRPGLDLAHPTAALVRATGKCAECHRQETSAVVHEFEMSRHNAVGVNCLECHRPVDGQEALDHRGFTISRTMTAANCKQCHQTEYDQYLRSRHAAPAWASVSGKGEFTAEQVAFSERFHKGAVDRKPMAIAEREGPVAVSKGCQKCHEVGRPNKDGSIGTCTACHARHAASVELARTPETCGQCHMGPDHSQIEIYHESKHGVLFNAQKAHFHLAAPPKQLTTKDMPVPTCATCHMSGLEGQKVTHDVTERLSYWLFAATSEKRPTYAQGQANMKDTCLKCHTTPRIEQYYKDAEAVVASTNALVKQADDLMKGLRDEKLLTPDPFDEPIDYVYFDLWHYFGRTAKHGAFMGGADFVQWHGFYEMNVKLVELKKQAEELRAAHRANSRAGGERGGK
ncbi:MAG: multiheme c-type cytochrome [Isosphaeraceae bacterium]